MQKRPTSKSLQCGSWVRVDMREVSYFSNERHGQKNVPTTLNRTLYRALALHTRRGSVGDGEGRDRGGKARTELVVMLMRWFPWPSFRMHVLLECMLLQQITSRVFNINHNFLRCSENSGEARHQLHKDTHHDFLWLQFVIQAELSRSDK